MKKLVLTLLICLSATAVRAEDGQAVYEKICHYCHEDGILGAPKIGDVKEWKIRRRKGLESLYTSALEGFGHMSPRLNRRGFDEASIKKAVDFLLRKSK